MRLPLALCVAFTSVTWVGTARAKDTPLAAPEPYLDDAAFTAFTLEKWQEARDGFARKLAATQRDDAKRARLGFLIAWCDARLGNWKDAASGFDAAANDVPLIADYARYEAARAYYYLRDFAAARERAEKISKGAVLEAEGRLLLGDVLRAQGDWKQVEKLYSDYLATYPKGIRVAEARYWLAQAKEQNGHAIPDALVLYRQILVEAPLEAWNDRARERFDALVKKVKKAKRKKYTEWTADEYLTRGKVYFDAMRNEASEADFRAALKAKGLDKGKKCVARYHLAQSVFKQRQRARSAPLFDDAIAACAKTSEVDLQVRAAYQGGRAWSSAGDHEKALARFEQAENGHPTHSFADDARLRQAEQLAYLEQKGDKSAGERLEQTLATIPTRYPAGDMRGEALWRLAWRAWRAERYEDAIKWLDEEIKAVPHDENYWAEGQTHYWKGRAFEKLGKSDDALAAWERCARQYPLSYYALLALNRLREAAPKRFETLVAELGRERSKAKPPRFKPRAAYGEPGFQRASELLRLGLGREAERELAAVGLKPPGGKVKETDPDKAEQLTAIATLYDRAGRYNQSHWILRWSVLDYKLSWPNEASRAIWDVAYPRAFWHLLDPASTAQGYPTELLIAFVREESAFDPIMESFANAIGLTQMIQPTAERFGKGLGFEINRDNLRDPEKNVAVGSRWLGFLWQKFDRRLGLIVPAYNAGEGAVWKWLCERGDWPLDEFAEQIPYDETRNYSKRVLNSYFIYQFLTDGTVPEMPNDIPAHVINEKKCKRGAPKREETAEKPDKP